MAKANILIGTSSSSQLLVTENGLKRTHSTLDLKDNTDPESVDVSQPTKKRQLAIGRPPTSLKSVMKASGDDSESSLPTPEVTGGEENDDISSRPAGSSVKGDDEFDFDDADFEAEMEAELGRELSEEE